MSTMPPPMPAAVPEKNPLAVWSLVLGIFSPFCCGIVTGLPAIICGHMAYSRSGRMESRKGRGPALVGLILGYLAFALIPVQLAVLLPAFAKARGRTVEVVCFANLQMIQATKQVYIDSHNGEAPASVDELVNAGLLPKKPVCPSKKGEYAVGGKDENPTCSEHGDLIANPPMTKARGPERE